VIHFIALSYLGDVALDQHAISYRQLLSRFARRLSGALFAYAYAFVLAIICGTTFANAQSVQKLTPDLLSNYVASKQVASLQTDITFQPAAWGTPHQPSVDTNALSAYVAKKFVPTATRVENAKNERLCLAQALYHEARGEPEVGQWAVANVILNRVKSHLYPSTICGVVFQNAGGKKFKCQFTFACDGRSDMGGVGNRIVRESWVRSNLIAHAAFKQFQVGQRPDALPGSALYYHTKAVKPNWSRVYRAVAQIGSHIFYARS